MNIIEGRCELDVLIDNAITIRENPTRRFLTRVENDWCWFINQLVREKFHSEDSIIRITRIFVHKVTESTQATRPSYNLKILKSLNSFELFIYQIESELTLNCMCLTNSPNLIDINKKIADLYADSLFKIYRVFFILLNEIMLMNKGIINTPQFVLNESDFVIAQTDSKAYLKKKDSFKCHDFAFYKLNEPYAIQYIFDPIVIWPDEFFEQPFKVLDEWGYEVIRNEMKMPGDLVVYCSLSEEGILRATHFGIWKGSKVLSKFGDLHIYEHKVGDVFMLYGTHVFFCRKKIKSIVVQKFLNKMQGIYNRTSIGQDKSPDLSSFSNHLVQLLLEINMNKVFKRSIFNIEYNNNLRSDIVQEIKLLTEPNNPLMSKVQSLVRSKLDLLKTIEEKIFELSKLADKEANYS